MTIQQLPELAIHLSNHGSAREVVRLASRAEQVGVPTVWLSEDLYYRGALTTAAAIAVTTSRIHIGFGVIAPQVRHSVALAMETRTLLDLAPGRITLGLGAGVVERTRLVGKGDGAPLTIVRQEVEAVRALLAGDALDLEGVVHTSAGVRLTGEPPDEVPPVYVAAVGPKALAQAGRMADGVLLTMMCARPHAAWAADLVRQGAEAAGRATPPVAAYLPIAVDDDGSSARRAMKAMVASFAARWADLEFLSSLFTRWSELDPDRLQAVKAEIAAGRDGADLISDAVLDDFAVAGTPAECRDGLARFAEAGVTHAALDAGTAPGAFDALLDRWPDLVGG